MVLVSKVIRVAGPLYLSRAQALYWRCYAEFVTRLGSTRYSPLPFNRFVSDDVDVTGSDLRRQEYTGDDADLYLDDREAALRRAQEEKRKQQAAVPGILNPHEIAEEMQD